jgi:signal transduction histidine kinase
MRQGRIWIVCLVILALAAPSVYADEARRKMLEDEVNYGVKVLETKGKAGMEELRAYRFAGGEGYIYLTNMEFFVIMHPVAKELVGKDCTLIKDAKGKFFGAEMKGKALKDGEGWTSYWWPNPQKNNTPELKCSRFKIANMGGEKVVVYSALFGVTEAECK